MKQNVTLWLYFLMAASGVICFYYGAEVHPDIFLLMGYGMMFLGLLGIKYTCQQVLINRDKPLQDDKEENIENA